MTYHIGHEGDCERDPAMHLGDVFLCPFADRGKILQTLFAAYGTITEDYAEYYHYDLDEDLRWLRLHSRSDLHVPGLCNNETAVSRLILDEIVPKTRNFISSINFGIPNQSIALDKARQKEVDQALAIPEGLESFEVAYEDTLNWLQGKEQSGIRSYLAGDYAEAERSFLTIDEWAMSFVNYGDSFHQLVESYPVKYNSIILFASVALYYLCKIRSDPRKSKVYAGYIYASYVFAAEHGILALRLPSPVTNGEWSAEICLMLCKVFLGLEDSRRFLHYFSSALKAMQGVLGLCKGKSWEEELVVVLHGWYKYLQDKGVRVVMPELVEVVIANDVEFGSALAKDYFTAVVEKYERFAEENWGEELKLASGEELGHGLFIGIADV